MDEQSTSEKRKVKVNLFLRVAQIVLCALCLITFITLLYLHTPLSYVIITILNIAILTLLIVIISLFVMLQMRNRKENYHKLWIYIAFLAMICYIVCVALLIVQITTAFLWILLFAIILSAVTAIAFFLDFLYNLSQKLLSGRKKNSRRNQIRPENSTAVAERRPEEVANTDVCSMIECSLIVGNQLACNQQLCHVKWSGDQTSTPTPKLIFVQPCNTSIAVNKVCPECNNLNCEQCFKTENDEKQIAEKMSQTDIRSTQFPEDDDKTCPLCSFKTAKAFKTAYVQTSEFPIQHHDLLEKIPEEIVARERPRSFARQKLSQSSPVTPRKPSDLMVCPNCRKKNTFLSKWQKTHLCPLCNQQCRSKATCTSCYYSAFPRHDYDEQEKRKSTKDGGSKRFSVRNTWKNLREMHDDADESGTSSPEPFYVEKKKTHADKVVQVSLKDLFEDESPRKHECCRGGRKSDDYKARRQSSKEMLDDMRAIVLGQKSTEKLYENRAFGERSSHNESIQENESTQVSVEDFPDLQPQKEDKVIQVSISNFSEAYTGRENKLIQVSFIRYPEEKTEDKPSPVSRCANVQMERRPCGAPNCQHPKCGKYNKTDDEDDDDGRKMLEIHKVTTVNELIQTDVPKVDENTMTIDSTYCQTTKSLEELMHEPIVPAAAKEKANREELSECADPNCCCVLTDNEVCTYCQKLRSEAPEELEESGCKCNLPNCICCKMPPETDEAKESQSSSELDLNREPPPMPKCFCIQTETGLLKCTLCETLNIERAEASEDMIILPVCSSSVSTCLYYKPRDPEPEDYNKRRIMVASREHSTATSRRSSFQGRSAKSSRRGSQMDEQKHKKTEKDVNDEKEEEYASSEAQSTENEVEKRTALSEIQAFYKVEREDMSRYLATKEGISFSASPPTETTTNVTDDYLKQKMKVEWDTLENKRVTYQTRVRKEVETNVQLNDDSMRMLERTQLEMQTIYNNMIKNLLERHTKKEKDIIFLEKMKCGCEAEQAPCSKHQDCCANKDEEIRQNLQLYPLIDCSKLTNKDDTTFDIKDRNLVPSSSDLIISENVSLSTITEEISGTPSELISISKESEPSILLEADKQDKPDVQNPCNNYRAPEAPCKQKLDEKTTPKPKSVSPKPSSSARSAEKGASRKSAGFYDHFVLSPTHGSTKTSFTNSDNESTFEINQHHQQHVSSSASASSCEETPGLGPGPISKSVPITSRSKTLLTINDQEAKKVFYCGYSIPNTPKKIHWEDLKLDSSRDASETSPKKLGGDTFRKESDYDEGNETPSMVLIKNFHPADDLYETDECMQAKIVPPLPIENITSECSEFEESQPISCSSHFSARTLQTIENYSLEYSASELQKQNKPNKYVKLQQSKKRGVKSQPVSTRTQRKSDMKLLSVEPSTMRERRISAPSRTSQRRKTSSSSPRMPKCKSATSTYRQKTIASALKSCEKKKMKSAPGSLEQDQICHCKLYKNSKTNYCRLHGVAIAHPKVKTVFVTTKKKSPKSPKSSRKSSPSPKNKDTERAGTSGKSSEKSKSSDEESPKSKRT